MTASTDTPTDAALLARARDGDGTAFRTLVERYEPTVTRTVASMLGPQSSDVDDVLQETFIRFYRSLGDFREEASVQTYLKRIAVNRSLDVLRRRTNLLSRFFSRDAEQPSFVEAAPPSTDTLEARERDAFVQQAIQALPPKHRAVIVLRLIDGYSTEETAQMLGIAYGTVLSRLSRARATLQSTLRPYLEDSPLPPATTATDDA